MTRNKAKQQMALRDNETIGEHKWNHHNTFVIWYVESIDKIYDDFEDETAMCKNCVMFETINCPLDYEIRNKKEFCYDDFGCKGFIKKAD